MKRKHEPIKVETIAGSLRDTGRAPVVAALTLQVGHLAPVSRSDPAMGGDESARVCRDLPSRFAALPAPHPADRLRLRLGTMADYAALSEHHYRAQRPATATRVLVLEDPRPSIAERFASPGGDETVLRAAGNHSSRQRKLPGAVLVESLPSLSCRMRDWALRERYGSHLAARSRAALLNAEVRCISRVVVAPAWRGLGLAVRLVRAALAEPTTPVTEALAAMGKVNPFFERAGMTAYPRPTHAHDARFIAALGRVGLAPRDLALLDAAWSRIDALDRPTRGWLLKELHRWYRQYVGRASDHETDPRKQLVVARERLMLEPVYYVKVHGVDTCDFQNRGTLRVAR